MAVEVVPMLIDITVIHGSKLLATWDKSVVPLCTTVIECREGVVLDADPMMDEAGVYIHEV